MQEEGNSPDQPDEHLIGDIEDFLATERGEKPTFKSADSADTAKALQRHLDLIAQQKKALGDPLRPDETQEVSFPLAKQYRNTLLSLPEYKDAVLKKHEERDTRGRKADKWVRFTRGDYRYAARIIGGEDDGDLRTILIARRPKKGAIFDDREEYEKSQDRLSDYYDTQVRLRYVPVDKQNEHGVSEISFISPKAADRTLGEGNERLIKNRVRSLQGSIEVFNELKGGQPIAPLVPPPSGK